jgi:hypothetical protein
MLDKFFGIDVIMGATFDMQYENASYSTDFAVLTNLLHTQTNHHILHQSTACFSINTLCEDGASNPSSAIHEMSTIQLIIEPADVTIFS